MKKFLIQYKIPLVELDEWMKKPKEETKDEEEKMMKMWRDWTDKNKENILETYGTGKTRWLDQNGSKDFRNEIMLISIARGESKEEVAEIFKNHPHLEILKAWIEISDLSEMD